MLVTWCVLFVVGQVQIGDDSQQDSIRIAAEEIKCDICHALVASVFARAEKLHSKSETNILDISSTICGSSQDMAPPFSLHYKVEQRNGKYVLELNSKESDGALPQPVFRMDWQSVAMKKACDRIVSAQDSEIAEAVFLEFRKKVPSYRNVVKQICACKSSRKWKSEL